jgi:lipopolysaccharide biosynthesis glycosyltransferase
MNKSVLVTLADKKFVNQAKQLFSSVYFNAGWKGDYLLLSVGIPEKDLEWFRQKGILINKCSLLSKNKIGSMKMPSILLSKFYLFKPEFKKWKNVIFLDSDIIVRAPIDKLAKVNGFYVITDAEPHNLFNQFYKKKILFKQLKQKYNLNKLSFNSGVMAFSTDIIKEDTFENLLGLFKKYHKIHLFGDQPTFNLFFYQKWKKLPIVWNIYTSRIYSYGGISYLKLKGIILHMIGKENEKPWCKENFFYNEWKNNLEKAEFIDLNKPQKGKPKWSFLRIYYYSIFLVLNGILYDRFKNFKKDIKIQINYLFGLFGRKIKKISPKLYIVLKKDKKKFFNYEN